MYTNKINYIIINSHLISSLNGNQLNQLNDRTKHQLKFKVDRIKHLIYKVHIIFNNYRFKRVQTCFERALSLEI